MLKIIKRTKHTKNKVSDKKLTVVKTSTSLIGLVSQGQHCSKIMKHPQSLPPQMAERLLELS